MKTFFLSMLFITQALFSSTLQAENFVYDQDNAVIAKYGDYAFKAVRKPAILKAVLEVYPNFKTKEVGTSFPTKTTRVNGEKIAIISGCTPNYCGNTQLIIFISDITKRVYVLKQDPKYGYKIFGMPDQRTKEMMINFFETQ